MKKDLSLGVDHWPHTYVEQLTADDSYCWCSIGGDRHAVSKIVHISAVQMMPMMVVMVKMVVMMVIVVMVVVVRMLILAVVVMVWKMCCVLCLQYLQCC